MQHWIFNAIEIIWSIVKDKVAVDNKTDKLADVKKHVHKAFRTATCSQWKNAVKHTIEQEEFYWRTEGLRHSEVESIVIPYADIEESSDSERDEWTHSQLSPNSTIEHPAIRQYRLT